MGRLTQGHFDDVFLNKVKQACVHVLDQLNEANEIEQAFDLCPSISRRNRVILSFLRDADHVRSGEASSSSYSTPLSSLLTLGSTRPSREASLGTDSVTSLSAQRRRRAREMQYVRDLNDSNDDSDSQATVGPSTSSRAHLDPASARIPSMSQPDYSFEQFAEHLDPTDKLLKRSLEIIIKETARQALAKKRGLSHDPATASAVNSSRDPAASLRSAIASSRTDRTTSSSRFRGDTGFSRRMSPFLNVDTASRHANANTDDIDPTYPPLRALRPAHRSSLPGSNHASSSTERRTLRNFLHSSSDGLIGSTPDLLVSSQDAPTFGARVPHPTISGPSLPLRNTRPVSNGEAVSSILSPNHFLPQLSQRISVARSSSSIGITPQTISARLAEASRRNAQAARTIGEAERLRSSQFIRTCIESLRASLFQLHMDLACTQLQSAQRDATSTQPEWENSNMRGSYALVMDTIELFDDTLRRLSCLVSSRNGPAAQEPIADSHADAPRERTSLWRARHLLLLSSMSRPTSQLESTEISIESSTVANSRREELRAHRHWLSTLEESHWARSDVSPPCSDSIRTWRRKLAAWYYLDRDTSTYPSAPPSTGVREETYARWHPDLELPYALDDEIMGPMTNEGSFARPDPITNPRAAWEYARRHDDSLRNNLNEDDQVRQALGSSSVASALQRWLRLSSRHDDERQALLDPHPLRASGDVGRGQSVDPPTEHTDPDISLTRTTSLRRRNAVRALPLHRSDSSSIRSARSSLSLRQPEDLYVATQMPYQTTDDNDAIDEDVVETSIEIGTLPPSPEGTATLQLNSIGASSLLPLPERSIAGRSGSFTFITTPAAVLRSRQRSESRGHLPAAASAVGQDEGEDDEEDADDGSGGVGDLTLDDRDVDAEEYIDLDLDLGMAGDDTFDFDLTDFLQIESRRLARRRGSDDHDDDEEDANGATSRASQRSRSARNADYERVSGGASPTGIRVYVSGSGASTPAEARQATFEAYAQRARLLERQRRVERQRREQEINAASERATPLGDDGDGGASHETSQDNRRRRRRRNIGGEDDSTDRRDSLPFPRRTSLR